MNRITLLYLAVLITASTFAQTPQKMSYQAVIRNASNALITNQIVGMRISILQGSASGTAVYTETQTPTTNSNGLITIEIGGGTLVSGSFLTINWANGLFFVKTETDPSGGNTYSITGTSQLLSVPYALHAKTADSIIGGGALAHYIGEQFGGGVIFHLWKDAQGIQHGLIADLTDLSTSKEWSNVNQTIVGPSCQSTWNGASNCNAIVSQAGHSTSAAFICLNSTNNGQSDWYLPSIDELSLLWHNRFNVNKSLSTISGANQLSNSARYWSSTEFEYMNGFIFNFLNGSSESMEGSGGQGYSNKASKHYVRAVRAF